jgi:hypothetical protein
MGNRNINQLDDRLKEIAVAWRAKVNGAIAPSIVRITDTWRAPAEQAAAFAAGLSKAGPGASPHNCCTPDGKPASRGFDFSVFGPDGAYVANGEDPRYAKAGAIAEAMGLTWGGAWREEADGCKPDYDHCQLPHWRTP